MNTCNNCQNTFEITEIDRGFYKKFDVPEPSYCPSCRQQIRLTQSNQMNLFKRKADESENVVVSCYPPEFKGKVYAQEHWHSDRWNTLDFGRDFDFNRPFFEQFKELLYVVPRPALYTGYRFDDNSEYSNFAGKNRNCYMIFDSDMNNDCYYSHGINSCKNTLDCTRSKSCEISYECVDCINCFRLFYSQDCEGCGDSAFLKNCISVRNSFMCSNLKNKEYYIFNQPYSEEKYKKLMNSLVKHSALAGYFRDWQEFKFRFPQKAMHGTQNENVLGDYLVNCKDASYCFDCNDLWGGRYCFRCFGDSKDCMDCDEFGDNAELCYDCLVTGYGSTNCMFCFWCLSNCHDLYYSFHSAFSSQSFGCAALSRNKYCILNKQYEKEDYLKIKERIIQHMKETGEWGRFFPVEMSDFPYNLTIAQEYFPLTKAEVLAKGWKWRDRDESDYKPADTQIPDDSKVAEPSICKALFACVDCGRNYRILEQELRFYKEQGVAIPKKCFFCRHKARFNLRNKMIIYDRKCDKCGIDVKSTYEPGSPWIVYCEQDYQNSLC